MKRFLLPVLALAIAGTAPSAQANGGPCTSLPVWALLLSDVVAHGRVDYGALTTDEGRKRLSALRNEIAACDASALSMVSAADREAYWINAYNALTVIAVAEHYPIRASGWKAWRFPRNSIRQIDGVWTDLRFDAGGAQRTLDEIEHQIVRKQFADPLAHVGLNCASMSCPPLRDEPYVGARLHDQLIDQLRVYAADPVHGVRIDRQTRTLWLSRIFDWFGEDFAPLALPRHRVAADLPDSIRGVLALLVDVVSPQDRQWLLTADYEVSWLDYDWSLNEQRP
ncbi:MAG: DUF547 domain-containing protein [Candidatus Dadabacteria bacterium]|nr:MAG: DUF547 domain-containing protein [Candidatus Dadabacteria bacterium]